MSLPAWRIAQAQGCLIARLDTALVQQVQLGVLPDRPLHEAGQGGQLEGGEVLAGKEPDDVVCCEDPFAVDHLHARPLLWSEIVPDAAASLDLGCPGMAIGFVPAMKVREVLRLLREDGWIVVMTRGSHIQLKHPAKAGRVTVAGHPNDDVAPGTLKSILVQARLKEH